MTDSDRTRQGSQFAIFEYMVIAAAAVFLLIMTSPNPTGTNTKSRLATVERLVHAGTFCIDESCFETIDQVYVDGRFLSSKPPVLPTLMAGEYWVLYHVFGYDIRDEEESRVVIKILTLTFMGLPFIVYLLLLRTALNWYIKDGAVRLVMLIAGAFCNHAMGMAITVNNHVPAGATLFAAGFLCLGLVYEKIPRRPLWFVVAGLLIATASILEFWCLLFVPFFLVYLVSRTGWRSLGWCVLGVLPMAVLHLALTYGTLGTFLPAYLYPEWYKYPGSYWLEPLKTDALREPKYTYFFNMMFGFRGEFSHYPMLLVSALAVILAWRDREFPLRSEVLGVGSAVLFSIAINCAATNNYGGCSPAFRGFIHFSPLFLSIGALSLDRIRHKWQWIVVAVLLAASAASMVQCVNRPWTCRPSWVSVFFKGPEM